VLLTNNGVPDAGTEYEYDWIRQRQKSDREKIKKYAKMKKRIDKLSAKNRVVKRK
jgi:phage protein D